jgi:hypothetical protein
MVLQAAIEGLNATVGKAIGRIENAIAISDQAQKASLALGMSLQGANKTLDGSIKGLRGSFGTRLQAGIAALNAGFQGNIESVGKLINQQQLTGGSFKKTAASLAKLETTMGLTRGQTSDLAEAMLETSQTFGVSTDKLVASLDALSESMPILTEAGLAGVPGAVAAMAGRVGPQMEQELKRVMGFLFDPSMETQGKLAALGLGNLRERMAAGQNPLDAFLDAIPQASNVIGQLGGDLSQFYAGFSVPLKMFGPVAKDFIALQKAMSARNMVEVRNQAEFFEQISVLKSEILAPLDMLFSDELFPKVKEFVDLLGRVAKPIIQNIEERVRKFLNNPALALGNFVKNLDKVQVGFTKVINGLITGVNIMTRGMLKFIEQLNEIWTIDMLPDSAVEMSKAIEEERSQVSAQTGALAEIKDVIELIKTNGYSYAGFRPSAEDISKAMDRAMERIPDSIEIQVSNAMIHGGKTKEEGDKLRIKLLQDHLSKLTKDRDASSKALKEKEAYLEDFFMKTADKFELEKFEIVPDRFANLKNLRLSQTDLLRHMERC